MNFKFANINAKVKGMYAKVLKQSDYDELCKQKTIKEALILLKQKLDELQDIGDNARRREIEKQLEKGLANDIQKIYRLLDKKNRQLLTIYLQKQEIQELKEKLVLLQNDENAYIAIQADKQQTAVEKFMLEWIDTPYYPILQKYLEDGKIEELSIFKLENELDKFYFTNLYEEVKKRKNQPSLDLIRKANRFIKYFVDV